MEMLVGEPFLQAISRNLHLTTVEKQSEFGILKSVYNASVQCMEV